MSQGDAAMVASAVDIFGDEVGIENYELPMSWGGGAYDHLSDEELIALANADVTPVKINGKELVRNVRKQLGRKFEVSDITDTGQLGQDLYDAAAEWLGSNEAIRHNLDFVRDISRKYLLGGGLTDGQAKGILNCMAAVRPEQNRGYGPSIEKMNATAKPQTKLDADDQSYEAWLDFQASAIGMGYYTVVHEDGSHTTVKVGKWGEDKNRPGRKIRWISYLAGSSNTDDYEWFARQGDGEGYVIAPKHRMNGKLGTALRVIFHEGGVHDAAKAYALESGNCARCNRLLTHPESIRDGYGPECIGKVGF
jgi:hypothetical protein